MPIIGMTDRGAAFPRIGELRKGGEKVSANRPGPDLDYFRFTSKDPDALAAFTAAYGNQPRAVNCYLPYATAGENFEAWIEEWQAGGLVWRGDGQTAVMWRTPQGQYSQERKPQPAGGKQVGRLKIIVPELGRLAYVTALTTSTWDIMDMASVLEGYQALRGNLQGIPFVLSRVPRMVSTPGQDGKRARREKWLWHLEAQPVWVQAQLSAMQRAALPGSTAAPLQITAASIIDMDTGEITEDDYEDEAYTVQPPAPQQHTPRPPFQGQRQAAPMPAEEPAEYRELTLLDAARQTINGIKNPTLGEIGAELVALELYKHGRHVLNAVKQYPFSATQQAAIDKGKFTFDSGQAVATKTGLELFDWLVARKDEAPDFEPAGPDEGDGDNMPMSG